MNTINEPILAIETSGELCSAAIFFNADKFYELNIRDKHIHSEKLAVMVAQLLKEAKLESNQLGCVALSEGPGSFTGLRIGFAVGKGIAFGAGLPVISVPTFDALAYQISQNLIDGSSFCIVTKVNTEEVYFRKYTISDGTLLPLTEIEIIKTEQISGIINPEEIVFGNAKLEGIKKIASPNAFFVAKWSYFFGKDLLSYDYDFLEPNYLKKFIARKKK